MADGSDEYVCAVCGKRFASEDSLEDHVKTMGLVY